jgi:hypothetical protein
VTAGAAALGPPEEALNRLADAAPGAAEPFPPDRNDPPFCSDGNIAPRPAEEADVCAVVVAVVGCVVGSVVVIFGSVVLTGSVVVIFGSVVLTGSVVVIFGTVVLSGSVVVIFGSVVLSGSVVVIFGTVVLTGSVVVIFGSVVLTGSVVVIFGSVVLTGSVVVIVGSAVVIRSGAADRPGTAVPARKPRRRRGVRAAARFTALEYPIGHITIQFEGKRPSEPLCPDLASFGNR